MHVVAAVEPLTPVIFLAVAVVVLMQLMVSLARRTKPLRPRGGGGPRRTPARPPAPTGASFTASVAGRYSRWTPVGFWRRMDADLAPLSPDERQRLLDERIRGLSDLRARLGETSADRTTRDAT